MGFCNDSISHSIDSTETQERNAKLIHGVANETLYSMDRMDSAEISLEYFYYAPLNEGSQLTPYQKTLNEIVYQNTLWNTLSDSDSDIPMSPMNPTFFESQLDTVASIYEESQEEYEYGQIWAMDMYTQVTDHKFYVDLLMEEYNYLGGAHGNSSTVYYQIDRASGRVLGLSDFFADLEAVNKISETYFRELYDLQDVENWEESDFWFSEEGFEVSEIFNFTANTVTFLFNTYAIAPYYYGPISVEVPLSALEGHLTDYCISNL
jgi:hypothetical protein